MKKLYKKLKWKWKCFWGKKFFITIVDEGLLDDEILIKGHRLYISKELLNKIIKK